MNFPKFPHSAMFVSAMNVGKTEYLLRILETEYKNHFELIVIFILMDLPMAKLIKLAKMAGVMHEADHAYSIRSTW